MQLTGTVKKKSEKTWKYQENFVNKTDISHHGNVLYSRNFLHNILNSLDFSWCSSYSHEWESEENFKSIRTLVTFMCCIGRKHNLIFWVLALKISKFLFSTLLSLYGFVSLKVYVTLYDQVRSLISVI